MEEFFNECLRFDWYYSFSDDHRVYMNGSRGEATLIAEAESNPKKMEIFKAWKAWHFSGDSWGTPKAPKPLLENYK